MEKDMTIDELVEAASAVHLYAASMMLDFSADVLREAVERRCEWVVLRAVSEAEGDLRDAVHTYDCDESVVDSRLSAMRQRLGISNIAEIVKACAMQAGAIDGIPQAEEILHCAGRECCFMGFRAQDAAAAAACGDFDDEQAEAAAS